MSTSRLVSAAVLAACTVTSATQASVVGLWSNSNSDVTLGDYITSVQIGAYMETPTGASLAWTANTSNLDTSSGPCVNPLYQEGSPAENPFYHAATLRMTFGGLSSVCTWTDGQPLLNRAFNVTFYLSDLADASATPLAVLNAPSIGTPPRDGARGAGANIGVIFNHIDSISFNGNLPFTYLDGTAIAATYSLPTVEGASWTGITFIPAPGAAALLGLGGLMASRRRRV